MFQAVQRYQWPLQTSRLHASPFLKWAGGKTQLISELDKDIPHFSRYFEPFLGGGALFFHLASSRPPFAAYLSDANAELVNAYQTVKGNVKALISALERHQIGYLKKPARYYYSLRNRNSRGRVEKAARLIALNKTCYNGLYRVNRDGMFNVPMGRYANPAICNRDLLESANRALNMTKARVRAADYKRALQDAGEGDFVYLDPPFVPLSRTANFVDYTEGGFSEKDQVELARTFRELDRKKCRVLLSNSDTELARMLYGEFSCRPAKVARAISCKSNTRSGYTELIIRNYSL
jgi:DNA adenine methylase